jgi:hypothetical protein
VSGKIGFPGQHTAVMSGRSGWPGQYNVNRTHHSGKSAKLKALSFSCNLSTAASDQFVVFCDVAPCALAMDINFYSEKGGSIF